MPMVRSDLAKIGNKLHGNIQWMPKIILRIGLSFTEIKNKQENKKCLRSSLHHKSFKHGP
jgi:hypothetical protein